MATKTFKIGLSNTDKQNMAQDVYERLLDLTFAEYNSSQTYNTGDFVVYNDALYQCLADNVTGTWDATKWQSATLQDLVDDVEDAVASVNGKANTIDLLNGTLVVAKSLSAKSIENLSQDSGSTQDDPFIAQGTGTNNNTSEVSTSPVAKQLEKQGNTIVRNQLVQNGNFASNSGWGTYQGSRTIANNKCTFLAIASYGYVKQDIADIINGHSYIICATITLTTQTNKVLFGLMSGYNIIANSYKRTSGNVLKETLFISFNATQNYSSAKVFIQDERESDWDNIIIEDVSVIDLTQWGLSDDVITRLTSHPEEWLNYDCTDDSYKTGTIKNADGVTLVTIKKNIWDEQLELGYIDVSTGEDIPSSTNLRSKDYIRVIPNRDIYFRTAYTSVVYCPIFFYDKDKNFIGSNASFVWNRSLTIPSNCIYIRFYLHSGYGTTYNNDISLYLVYWKDNDDHSQGMDGDHYNTYLPYEKHEYNTGSEVLRSAGSVKDYKTPDGTIHRLVGVVDLGSLDWTKEEVSGNFSQNYYFRSELFSSIKEPSSTSDTPNITCVKYLGSKARADVSLNTDKVITIYANRIGVVDSSYTSGNAAAFKTAMSGVYLYYELAEPTTEQGTSFPENIEVDDYGMMYWLDGDGNFVTTPQGCKFFYPADYVLLIDDLNNYTNGDVTSLAKKSDIPTGPNTYLTSLAGYDATKTQTLKNVNGVFTWVDD